jgi:predicted metal-dependent hydrolase
MRERTETPDDAKTFEEQFQHGVDLFNEKEFFDCHDAFEDLWHEERGERRLFLQGLIQAAVGCYHLSNGNVSGALSQYQKSLDKLTQYPESYLGLNVARLRTELAVCRAGAEAMFANGKSYEVDSRFFPTMHVSESDVAE